MQEAQLKIKKRFGKNAILRGLNFEEGATAKHRNEQIGPRILRLHPLLHPLPECGKTRLHHLLARIQIPQEMRRVQAKRPVIHPEKLVYISRFHTIIADFKIRINPDSRKSPSPCVLHTRLIHIRREIPKKSHAFHTFFSVFLSIE